MPNNLKSASFKPPCLKFNNFFYLNNLNACLFSSQGIRGLKGWPCMIKKLSHIRVRLKNKINFY